MNDLENLLMLKQFYQQKSVGYCYIDLLNKNVSNGNFLKTLPNNIDDLNALIEVCQLCSLGKLNNNVLFSQGDKNAKLMFILDYPFQEDNKNNTIFSTPEGELLKNMIQKVLLLSIDDIYITYHLKCKPQTTQNIDNSLLFACRGYLDQQIKLIKPNIIVTLGDQSYKYLTHDTNSFEKIRGKTLKFKDKTLIATYSPEYILKNPTLKKDIFIDLKKIKSLL